MPMIYDKVVSTTNKIIEQLNEQDLSLNETIAVLGQLLIYTGGSLSKQEIDFDDIDWNKLERIYYMNDQDNDVGLGVMLNGGNIMQAINDEFITSNANAKETTNDNQVSATNQISQKISTASSRSSKTKRRSNTRRKNAS
jgi:hypothetical protein